MRALLGLSLLLGACASCAGRIPLPKHLEVKGPGELLERMRAAATRVKAFSAEARLTYFGPEGRVRTSATIVAQRPTSLRYDLMGPHGGVVSAFATNGLELMLLDVAQSRFLHGPATAKNLDKLLPFMPLGLVPEALVGLLFGELPVPEDATLAYDDRIGRFVFSWTREAQRRTLEIDPETSRLRRAAVHRAGEQGGLVSEVQVEDYDDHGMPASLHVRVPKEDVDVEIELRDLTTDPELDADVFLLSPPAGVRPEYLSTAAELPHFWKGEPRGRFVDSLPRLDRLAANPPDPTPPPEMTWAAP